MDESGLKKSVVQSEIGTFGKVSEMARSGGLFTPFGPSSQAPTLFRFALLEPEEVLIISVALTNLLINEMGGENILLRGRFLKWRAREDSNLRPPGS